MPDTLRCPGCAAELILPPSADGNMVQCPRCRQVMDQTSRSSAAVTAASPAAAPTVEGADHEQFKPTPRVAKLFPPAGGWFAYVFSSILVGNVVVFSICAYLYFERTRQPDAGMGGLWAPIGILAVLPLGLLFPTFVIWSFIADRNSRHLNAATLLPVYTLVIAYLICPMILAVEYVHLQQLWQSSDPHQLDGPVSWRNVTPSWLIRVWGLLCLGVPAFALVASYYDRLGRGQAVAVLLMLTAMCWVGACALLIVIVHRIGRRQFERYIRLYEDPA
jgi:hypothetical protein